MKVRICIAIALLSCLLHGCAYTYGIPRSHRYIHLPEYGYLPVHDRFIYVDFVAYDLNADLSRPVTGIDNIQKLPRQMLPQTLNEAKSLVDKNLENLEPINQRRRSEMTASIPETVVKAPIAMLYWAPVIGGVIQQFDPPTSTRKPDVKSSPQASEEKNRKQLPRPDIGVGESLVTQAVVDVSGPRGEKVPDATVLLLLSPSVFGAYADDSGHRTFPKRAKYWFHLTEPLASSLAKHLDSSAAPSASSTDRSGRAVASFVVRDLPEHTEDAEVFVLVKKSGYRASTTRIPLFKFIKDPRVNVVLGHHETSSDISGDGADPWIVARLLLKQIKYYETKYYNGIKPRKLESLTGIPSIPLEEFELLLHKAVSVAPDYPDVQTARFYYELEKGRPEAAKNYHRFIEDKIYVSNIYKLIWIDGIPLR